MQIKVIASSAEPLQLTPDTNLGFAGLAGITDDRLIPIFQFTK